MFGLNLKSLSIQRFPQRVLREFVLRRNLTHLVAEHGFEVLVVVHPMVFELLSLLREFW
jgi:hypothetical protein